MPTGTPAFAANLPCTTTAPVAFTGTGMPARKDFEIEVDNVVGDPLPDPTVFDRIYASSDHNGNLNCTATRLYPAGGFTATARYYVAKGGQVDVITSAPFTVS